jgi:RHS repeat-associated protein
VATYEYDASGQISEIRIDSTAILTGALYEPFGPVRSWNWGNGTVMSRTYDTDGRLAQLDSAGLKSYSYDDAFSLTSITDEQESTNSWAYGYDLHDRLTSASQTGVLLGWTYDANGNRLTQTGSSATAFTISPVSNRVLTMSGTRPRSYVYDETGNATSWTTASASYDPQGRLKTVTAGGVTVTYVYNAIGQLIRQSGGPAGTILYVYDEAGHAIGEYSGTGALIQETLWLGDVPVATIRPNGQLYYVHTNHLNAPIRVTRASDNKLIWAWNADPFGTTAANENPENAGLFQYNLRFPGQLYDSLNGLHHNYWRDYDPALGRYIEGDPIGLTLWTLSLYPYADSDPVNNIDSDGRLPLPLITGLIGAGAGAVGNITGQLSVSSCKPFSWTDLAVATGGGFVAGVIAPYVSEGVFGSAVWGGAANVLQYAAGSLIKGEQITAGGTAVNAVTGILGAAIGGAVSRASPWGYGGTAAPRAWVDQSNHAADVRLNTNVTSLLRNLGGGIVGNALATDMCECMMR